MPQLRFSDGMTRHTVSYRDPGRLEEIAVALNEAAAEGSAGIWLGLKKGGRAPYALWLPTNVPVEFVFERRMPDEVEALTI